MYERSHSIGSAQRSKRYLTAAIRKPRIESIADVV